MKASGKLAVMVCSAVAVAFVAAAASGADAVNVAETLKWFDDHVYGPIPPRPAEISFALVEDGTAFGGEAVRRQYRIFSRNAGVSNAIDVLIYLPPDRHGPVPAFVCPNFYGNHTVTDDEKVFMPSCRPYGGKVLERGAKSSRLCVRDVLARGYIFATYCYGSTYPDATGDGKPGCFERDMSGESVWRMFPEVRESHPLAHGAWAWGTMRVRDLLETLCEVDQDRVAIVGHSRMAKSAVIAGAHDARFALVCANGGGLKPLAELPYAKFPNWFKPKASPLRFEQCDLLKCIAPRALFVSSADNDRYQPTSMANATADAAEGAWKAFGGAIGRHARPGEHAITPEDWKAILDYAEKTLGWKGPQALHADPDDQYRFFWGIHQGVYANLVAMGFNMMVDGMGSNYSFKNRVFYDRQAPAFTNLMPRMAADGVSFVMQLGYLHNKQLIEQYPRTFKDGKKDMRVLEVENPEALSQLDAAAEACAAWAAKWPACIGVQPASEVRIRTHPSCTPAHAERYRRETGREMPPEAGDRAAPHWSKLDGIPADRAIDGNHPMLAYYRWFWKSGDGWNAFYERATAHFNEAFGHTTFSMYDPCVRCPPLWGSGGPVTHINQWQVLYPFPSRLAYIASEVQAMARGRKGQEVLLMPQGIASRWEIAPKELDATVPDKPAWYTDRPNVAYLTTPADLMRIGLWEVFSRQTDGFGFHGWNTIFDGVPHGDSRLGKGYQHTDPNTAGAIADEFCRAAIPLGPLFKAIPERAPQIAILESYASAILSGTAPWDWKMRSFRYGELAQLANLAPYTIYEEEIARDGIPETVKVLLMPNCDVLTRTTVEKVNAFRARGGKVAGEATTCPAVGAMDAILPEVLDWHKVLIKMDGAQYDAAFRAIARELRRLVVSLGVEPYADVDEAHLLARVRSTTGADYLFAINDRRTFGGATGPWKRIMEVGLPNAGKVSVGRKAGAVYDLVRHERVQFSALDGRTAVPVSFTGAGGTVFLVADRPLRPLSVRVRPVMGAYEVTVTSPDRDVMVPVAVTPAGGKTMYGVVKDGVWRRRVPATRVQAGGGFKAVSLADGSTARAMP